MQRAPINTTNPSTECIDLALQAHGLAVAFRDMCIHQFIDAEHNGLRGVADALETTTDRLTMIIEDAVKREGGAV